MQVDKTTLSDLSIFNSDEDQSIFHFLNFTQTNEGRDHLYKLLSKPLETIESIKDTQTTIQQLQTKINHWPKKITNGTIMVLEKFYETPISNFSAKPSLMDAFIYKLLNGVDYSLIKYSVTHCIYFLHGMQQIKNILQSIKSKQIDFWNSKIELNLQHVIVEEMLAENNVEKLGAEKVLRYTHFIKHHFKHHFEALLDVYSKIDAFISLAIACTKHQFSFPDFVPTNQPYFNAEAMHHPLLEQPVSYSVSLNKESNFLFLTGANMAGKSTFIKTVGISVYLAHLGMGVPAKKMELSLFDGLLSNIHVMDNILKGESYFFNEVQRIKSTVERISNGKNWLILIDELFKGTNVQDAMKCSTTVIEGLHKMNNALFILSTHLYEIADDLTQYKNIQFKFFETAIVNDQLVFSYQLKEGISNDRLGYLILKKEGVVDLLNKL